MIVAPTPEFGLPFLHVALLKEWLPFALTPLIVGGYEHWSRMSRRTRRGYALLLAIVIAGFGALDAARTVRNIIDPPEFDVQAFWVPARVAAGGGNVYDVADVRRIAAPLQRADPPLSAAPVFTREVLDTGFLYPPPSMLWMAPFGHFALRPFAACWYAMLGIALIGSILLLWRTFFPDSGGLALSVVAALVLSLRATYTTFAFGQTSILLLFVLVLLWRDRDRARSGAWLAAGLLIKPIFAFFVAYPVLRRHWRAVGVFALAYSAAALAAFVVLGRNAFASYFSGDSLARAPEWLYTISENQSMLSAFLRLGSYDFTRGSPLTYPPFLAAAAFVGGVTFWILTRERRESSPIALAAAIPAALLIYPQTLDHYAVLLLVPMLFLWTKRETLGLTPRAVLVIMTLTYALVRYDIGSVVVVANALQWSLFAALWLRMRVSHHERPGGAPSLASR